VAQEFQKASGVWPVRVRPDWSVMVPDTITGRRRPRSSKSASIAKTAALAFQRVEDGLEENQVRAAVGEALSASP